MELVFFQTGSFFLGLPLRVGPSAISLLRQNGLTKDAASVPKPTGFAGNIAAAFFL